MVNALASRVRNKILKEPFEKRRHLARYLTSLVSAAFFTERERGDGEFYFSPGVRVPLTTTNTKRRAYYEDI